MLHIVKVFARPRVVLHLLCGEVSRKRWIMYRRMITSIPKIILKKKGIIPILRRLIIDKRCF